MNPDDLVEDIRWLLRDKARWTEPELVAELDVAPEHVRKAVDRLAQEGEVEIFGGEERNNAVWEWRRVSSNGRRS